MTDFGDKKYGLTGDTDGWRHDYVDLTPYAGQNVKVRLLYATDEAFQDRGWFVDDLVRHRRRRHASGATTPRPTTAGPPPWARSSTPPVPAGSRHGTSSAAQYYLVEWRNFDGFDKGLQYAYDTTYQADGAWKVEKIKYNAPGALVWYRDTSYGNNNHVLNNLTSPAE